MIDTKFIPSKLPILAITAFYYNDQNIKSDVGISPSPSEQLKPMIDMKFIPSKSLISVKILLEYIDKTSNSDMGDHLHTY